MEVKAAEADFTVRPHKHDGVQVTKLIHVCTTCGALGRTNVIWGRGPGQPWLDPDSEAAYVREQQS